MTTTNAAKEVVKHVRKVVNKIGKPKVCPRCLIPVIAFENISVLNLKKGRYYCTECLALTKKVLYESRSPDQKAVALKSHTRRHLQRKVNILLNQLGALGA